MTASHKHGVVHTAIGCTIDELHHLRQSRVSLPGRERERDGEKERTEGNKKKKNIFKEKYDDIATEEKKRWNEQPSRAWTQMVEDNVRRGRTLK